MDLSALLPPT
jgi:hypothetical protein